MHRNADAPAHYRISGKAELSSRPHQAAETPQLERHRHVGCAETGVVLIKPASQSRRRGYIGRHGLHLRVVDAAVGDYVARYRAASEANDISALMETLAADVELVSPISGRMVFSGTDDLRVLLAGVYGSLSGLHWHQEVGDDSLRVVIGDARIGPIKLGDAMVVELAKDGRIRRIRPHLRPWFALTLLALRLAPKMGRHPGLVWRAVRRG